MQFDNKHFESNVQTSISTLDKLKKSLNLEGASKGLENVNHAAQKCDLSPMGKGVEAVKMKFSALEVMAVTALANITNSAVNAGKRISSALTIDPIKTGFSEYETKMNAIQVIKANTRGKNTMEEITEALDELNQYADDTIYNFAQMTSNVGKFVAQGLDVKQATNAIKGLANLAGASGASAEDMSRATYQMSQALGGTIKLIDWNSLRNANMATTELKNTLIDLAKVHGIAIDDMIKKEGTFEQTLSQGWLTGEMFTEAMNIYSGVYDDAQLAAMGFTKSQIENFKDLARTAEEATTDVKTFTQLWEVLKETAQSGWAKSWELIVGDFDKSKERLSELKKLIEDPISKKAERRNTFLAQVFGTGGNDSWTKITEQVKKAGIDIDTFKEALINTGKEHGVVTDKMIKEAGGFEKSLKSGWANAEIFSETFKNMQKTGKATEDMTEKLKKFQKVVDEVWNGDYGNTGVFDQNGEDRVKKLEKAGYDYKTVQNLVNKTVDGHKLTLEDLNEAQMKNLGFTKEQIKALKDLQKQAKETGTPLNELIEDLTRPTDGGDLLWGSLLNTIKAFQKILGTIKGAWREVFQLDPMSIYNVIKWLNGFTEKLIISDETAGYLKRTLKGVFAMLDAIASIAGGAFKIAFQLVSGVLKGFDTNIWKVTAGIGDFLTKVAEWIKEHNYLAMGIEKLAEIITIIIKKLHEWITAFLELPQVQEKITQFKNVMVKSFTTVKDFIVKAAGKIKEAIKSIGSGEGFNLDWLKDIWGGIKKGFSAAFTGIGSALDAVKNFFKGFINVVKSGAKGIGDVFGWLFDKLGAFVNFIQTKFSGINIGNVLIAGISLGFISLLKKVADAFGGFAKILDGIGDIMENVGYVVKNFGRVLKGVGKVLTGYSWKLKAAAIRSMVISILMLVAAIALLSFLDQDKLWSSLAVLGAVAAGLVAFTFVMSKINTNLNMLKVSAFLMGVGSTLLTMALVVKTLGKMDPSELNQGALALIGMAGIIVALLAATNLIAARLEQTEKGKKFAGKGVKGIAAMLLSIAALMFVMTRVVKTLGRMDTGEMIQGLAAITVLSGLIVGLMAATKLMSTNPVTGDTVKGVASTMIGIAGALLMMSQVVKRLGKMNTGEMIQGLVATTILSGLIVGLLLAFRLIAKRQNGIDTDGIASTMLGISGALLLLTAAVGILGSMNIGTLTKGIISVGLLALIITGLIKATKHAQTGLTGVSTTLMGVGLALFAMSVAVKMLGGMDIVSLAKGVIAVGFLALFIEGLIKATQFAGGSGPKGLRGVPATLLAVGLAVMMLSLSIGLLSFIEPGKLAKATIAVGMMMSMFTALVKATSVARDCKSTIAMMAVTIALLALSIGTLSMIEPKNLIAASASLSAVMGMFAVMTKATGHSKKAIPMLVALTLVVAALAGIIWLMSGLPVESVLGTAAGLSMLMMSLATVAKTIGTIKMVSGAGLLTMGALLLIVGGLAAIIGILAACDVGPTLETAASLSILMLSLAAVCRIIQGVNPMAAAYGIAGYAIVVGGIGALLLALGALAQIPGLKWLLGEGQQVLGMIGYAIGNFVGSIIGGFAAGATSGLPEIAQHLSGFMTEIQPFLDGVSKLDASVLDGVKNLALMILILSAANLVESFTSWITGGSSLEKFARQLIPFGRAIVEFSDIVSDNIDPGAVEAAANAGKMMAEMAKTIPNSGGVVGFFAGENDLDDFAKKLVPFGTAMSTFSSIVSGNIDGEAVESAANAGKMMAEMASTIPNSGGVVGFFAGNNDIDKFGAMLPVFGHGIATFSEIVKDKIDDESVAAAINAGKAMAEMAKTIPNTGGLVSFFTGDNDLATFAVQLPIFGHAIASFSAIVKDKIDDDSVAAATNAGQALAEMNATIPNTGGLVSFFTGDNDIATFAVQLPLFGKCMADFAETVSGSKVAEDTVTAAANAGKTLAEMYAALPKEGGVWSIFSGCSDMAGFGTDLVQFGTGLASFATTMSGANISESLITTAANAGKTLAEMAKALPTDGGIWQMFAGATDIAAFGTDLETFGTSLAAFGDAISGIDDGAASKMEIAAATGKTLAEMAQAIPDSGGLWQWFAGAPNMEEFSGQLAGFGDAIAQFADAVAGKEFNHENVTAAANAGKTLAEMTQNGQVMTDFFGGDMAGFKTSLGQFGEAIAAFGKAVSAEGVNLDAVTRGANAGKTLAEMTNGSSVLMSFFGGDMSNFKTQLKNYAEAIVQFSNDLKGINTSELQKTINDIKQLLKDMQTISANGLKEVESLFEEAGPTLKDAIIRSLNQALGGMDDKAEDFATKGGELVDKLNEGAKAKDKDTKTTFENIATTGASGAKSESAYNSMYNAGVHLVSGFTKGIKDKAAEAAAAAAAMAAAAAAAAKAQLKIQSPSKVFYGIGAFSGMGLVNALKDYGSKVYTAGSDLANYATSGLSNAISKITAMIDSDMDTQPTIRPVLDLSNIAAGAGQINGMFDSPSIGVMSNLGAISSSMNNRQNGANNDDVIMAIKSLGSKLGSTGGDTYNINGVTYDDGSNVSSAVQTLVRAARVERRR
jgi:tape measure domain-containing protein